VRQDVGQGFQFVHFARLFIKGAAEADARSSGALDTLR
jgi:hypothetical protein